MYRLATSFWVSVRAPSPQGLSVAPNDAKLNTLRNAISRYNANESKKTGIDLYSRYIEDAHLMRIEARLNIKD